jgi:hypothetical protein
MSHVDLVIALVIEDTLELHTQSIDQLTRFRVLDETAIWMTGVSGFSTRVALGAPMLVVVV